MARIPCAIVRGGTSKGVFVSEQHLPSDPELRDRWLLAIMGSPDSRQIDGLGGADPLTSKVAIVAKSSRAGVDVEYESLEIGIAEPLVNRGIMCGNLIAGVGYFAIDEGLFQPTGADAQVRIYCRSNSKNIVARWQRNDGKTGSTSIELSFELPGGAVTGQLLPTREPCDAVSLDDGSVLEFSIVDAGTLYAFADAGAFGLRGSEDPVTLDSNQEFRARIESARRSIAQLINSRLQRADALAPRRIKMAILARPDSGSTAVDVVARVINPAKVHKAYAVSGGICLAAAAAIPGTIVQRLIQPSTPAFTLRIGHPTGVLPVGLRSSMTDSGVVIESAQINRTARVIMRGTVDIEC